MSARDVVAGEVRAEMARRRITQTQMAAAIGRPQPWLSRRLTGEVPFDVEQLTAVAEVLDVSIVDLVAPIDREHGVRTGSFATPQIPGQFTLVGVA